MDAETVTDRDDCTERLAQMMIAVLKWTQVIVKLKQTQEIVIRLW